jgi:hypothetical protein
MREMRNTYKILVRKAEGKKSFEDLGKDGYIKMELREIVWEDVDYTHLA